MTLAEPVPVAVVEDHPIYADGLVDALRAAPAVSVVAVARSLEALPVSDLPKGTVVLLDLHLPGLGGPGAVAQVVACGFAVLVLSASAERTSVVGAIEAGASGYLDKGADSEAVVAAIGQVAAGHSVVPPELASLLLDADTQSAHGSCLTPREREVLCLLAEGAADKTIARELGITLHTVHAHLDRIRAKTGRRRRAELTRLAVEEQLCSGRRAPHAAPPTMSESEMPSPGIEP